MYCRWRPVCTIGSQHHVIESMMEFLLVILQNRSISAHQCRALKSQITSQLLCIKNLNVALNCRSQLQTPIVWLLPTHYEWLFTNLRLQLPHMQVNMEFDSWDTSRSQRLEAKNLNVKMISKGWIDNPLGELWVIHTRQCLQMERWTGVQNILRCGGRFVIGAFPMQLEKCPSFPSHGEALNWVPETLIADTIRWWVHHCETAVHNN
jgi:hypothetical protein